MGYCWRSPVIRMFFRSVCPLCRRRGQFAMRSPLTATGKSTAPPPPLFPDVWPMSRAGASHSVKKALRGLTAPCHGVGVAPRATSVVLGGPLFLGGALKHGGGDFGAARPVAAALTGVGLIFPQVFRIGLDDLAAS